MRHLLFALLIAVNLPVFGQVFSFNNISTTLVKTVDQSPAHWYLEIFNEVGVDTTLRWKASFSNIPAAWVVNFDDEDVFYPVVEHGDSADFTLFSGLALPQKLIIGAAFNGVPGAGSIYFDIYDPNNPSEVTTIEYRYIVSASTAQLTENDLGLLYSRKGNQFIFSESLAGQALVVYDQGGRAILREPIRTGVMEFDAFTPGNVYYLVVEHNGMCFQSEIFAQ